MDYTLILIAAVLAVFVFFQFRSSRKRQRETAERQATIVPGVEIMTNFGLYGKLIDLDEDNNIALIETTPGTVLKIHRQTILKAVDDEKPAADDAAVDEPAAGKTPAPELNEDHAIPAGEPQYGERIEPEVKKPARRTAKKAAE
ncbi:MAG: preprotein translocase subunit YajC [Lacisediminihabitans sp.]